MKDVFGINEDQNELWERQGRDYIAGGREQVGARPLQSSARTRRTGLRSGIHDKAEGTQT